VLAELVAIALVAAGGGPVRRRQLGEPSLAVERLELVASAAATAIGEPSTAPGRVEVAAPLAEPLLGDVPTATRTALRAGPGRPCRAARRLPSSPGVIFLALATVGIDRGSGW